MGEILSKDKARQGQKLVSFYAYVFLQLTSFYKIKILEWYLLQKKDKKAGSISVESIHEKDLDILIKLLLLFNNEFEIII